MRGPLLWWRGKSTPAKVETYTRWSFHFFPVVEIVAIGLPTFTHVRAGFAVWLFLPLCAHSVLCAVIASRALDWKRGLRDQPVRLLYGLGAISVLFGAAVLSLVKHGPGDDGTASAVVPLYVGVLSFAVGTISLGVRDRRRVLAIVTCFAVGAGIVALAVGLTGSAALGTVFATLIGGGFLSFTSIFSVWLLDAVFELDAARETRTRLAVAEERLRFGRDLHDVMGRNLAVIALKSELAVQLARRERPEAVDQMIEVQRIARESQREVREVVRGYREADLGAELAGAQGVLAAAGVDCTVTGSAAGLPPAVQSALGWVVREATTNVLRHGSAEHCGVSLGVVGAHVVLTVENDGVERDRVPSTPTAKGSGLAGLRERLSAVDGTLEAGPVDGDRFRVVAEVPLPPAATTPKNSKALRTSRISRDSEAADAAPPSSGSSGSSGSLSSSPPPPPSPAPRSVNEEVTR
ncbi:sensor histidine kinase (plasmid) [Streptomyces sp. CWNU-52B]|uniref:sensor histidine kinase n=1 Tax=unclassified Streptomyces TaxID=2593676 RepID=UPI0039C126F4